MGNINIEIPKEVHQQVKVACVLNSTTLIEFVNLALKKKLKECSQKKGEKNA